MDTNAVTPLPSAIDSHAPEMIRVLHELDWDARDHRLFAGAGVWEPSETQHTYIVRCDRTGLVKIGKSLESDERLRNIQAMSPTPLRMIALLRGSKAERALHRDFHRLRDHGEWFNLPQAPLTNLIVDAAPEYASHIVLSVAFASAHSEGLKWACDRGWGKLRLPTLAERHKRNGWYDR